MRGFVHPYQNVLKRDPEQLVQGSQSTPRSFGRAELAIADGEPGFRGRDPPCN